MYVEVGLQIFLLGHYAEVTAGVSWTPYRPRTVTVSPSSTVLMCILLQPHSSSRHSNVGSDDHETKFAGEKSGLVDSTEGALGEHNSRQVAGGGGEGEVLEFHNPHL